MVSSGVATSNHPKSNAEAFRFMPIVNKEAEPKGCRSNSLS